MPNTFQTVDALYWRFRLSVASSIVPCSLECQGPGPLFAIDDWYFLARVVLSWILTLARLL